MCIYIYICTYISSLLGRQQPRHAGAPASHGASGTSRSGGGLSLPRLVRQSQLRLWFVFRTAVSVKLARILWVSLQYETYFLGSMFGPLTVGNSRFVPWEYFASFGPSTCMKSVGASIFTQFYGMKDVSDGSWRGGKRSAAQANILIMEFGSFPLILPHSPRHGGTLS